MNFKNWTDKLEGDTKKDFFKHLVKEVVFT